MKKIGQRIELHPATDEWMKGDKFGVIVGFKHAANYEIRAIQIKLDKSGKVKTFHPSNVLELEERD